MLAPVFLTFPFVKRKKEKEKEKNRTEQNRTEPNRTEPKAFGIGWFAHCC